MMNVTSKVCHRENPHPEHLWPRGVVDQFHCPGIVETHESLTERVVSQTEDDPVNHPSHYTYHPSGVECIEITRHMNFNLGNVVKYVWRAGMKEAAPTIQDLEKAAWYLADEIAQRKQEEESD